MKKLLLMFCIIVSYTNNAQNYQFLGSYTSNGTPNYLESPGDIVSIETLEMIDNALPESFPVPDYNPHYISSGYDTELVLGATAEVWVTFVNEGAGYRNVLGFYTYDVNNPSETAPEAEDITIIFPNVSALGSGGGLQTGDKVKIGTFNAGTGIGWVLLANAWQNEQVGSGYWSLYSNPDYNPESNANLRYHNVLLLDPENERIILGFEDIRRDYGSCDNDFNDAIFYVTANPYSALSTINYADVNSATQNVSSANNGGLESNGDLSSLIAKRNLLRSRTNSSRAKKQQQIIYSKADISMHRNLATLENYLPDTGMYGTETVYISSPSDLLEITNADEVFSIDIYNGNNRVSAVLATATTTSIYDHSKAICDRLNKSILEDVRTVTVRDHQIISSKIKRANGETEYTLSFSVKLGTTTNELYSFWNIEQYPPGDYYNFQIWGSSFSQVFSIANHIIDTLATEKLLSSTAGTDVVPTVFVRYGYYLNGQIHLDIINKTRESSLVFYGSIAETEVSNRFEIFEEVDLTGEWNQSIIINTGRLFDIGLTISTDKSIQKDALYLADGPWGIDYLDTYATVNTFNITNETVNYDENLYKIERQPKAKGLVKGTINLFRQLLPGDQTLTLTNYNAIQFKITNTQPVEIVLMPESLTNWENRLRYNIPINVTETSFNISLDNFVDANGNTFLIEDVKTVVFSISNDYDTFVPFEIDIRSLAFGSNSLLSVPDTISSTKNIINYPNPFKGATIIKLVSPSLYANVQVIDMLGRIVDSKKIMTTKNNMQVLYGPPQLAIGMYKYVLTDDEENKYVGTFLIN